MRLGTLARKISITPSKLTKFLESNELDLSSGTNTKLTESQVVLVLEHFNAKIEEPEQIESPVVPEPSDAIVEDSLEMPDKQIEEPIPVLQPEEEETLEVVATETKALTDPTEGQKEFDSTDAAPEIIEKPSRLVSDSFAEIALPHELEDQPDTEIASAIESEIVEAQEEIETPSEPQVSKPKVEIDPDIESEVERAAYDDSIEVIKPIKVKLPGLKVKGKIDLPEPKVVAEETKASKKEEKKPYDPDEIITTTGPKRDQGRKPKNYKGKKYNKDYNPLEAARKKKEWEAKKRKEQEEKRKKKAKSKHYNKKVVRPTVIDKAKKKHKKTVAKKREKQEQASGHVLKRFWRWMNT